MTQNWTETITTKMKMTKFLKKYKKDIVTRYVCVEKIL